MLFNKTRQYNIQIFNNIIFFKYRTNRSRDFKATETNNLLVFSYLGILSIHDVTLKDIPLNTSIHNN